MKRASLFLLVALGFSRQALDAGVFVHETASEYQALPELDANSFADVLIIHKATGLYRVGYGSAAASAFTFTEGRPSGMENITGVAAGRLSGTTVDSFAVTSPYMNRAHILSPAAAGYVEPIGVLDAGLGPRLLSAIDIPGGAAPTAEDDLAVFATLDLAQQSEIRQLRSNASTWSFLRSDDAPEHPVAHGNPIIPHTGAAALFAFMRDEGASARFQAYTLSGTSAVEVLAVDGLPPGSRYICGIFAGANADLMTWVPGQSSVQVHRIVTGAPWDIASSNSYDLGQAVAQLAAVNGPSGTGVAIRYDSGAVELRAYTLATGFSAPLAIVPTGASGFVSGLLPMPGAAFHVLYSATPGGPTSSLVTFENSGSGWTQTGITHLPALKPTRRFANVLLLEQPLFRGEGIGVLRTYQAGDWTVDADATGGGPVTISADAALFGGSTQGIGAASPQTLGTVSSSPGGSAVNQMHPQFSLVTFSENLGSAVDAVTISPPGGTYAVAQQITFTGVLPGTTVHYRIDQSGPFVPWNPSSPPWITRPTTVEFYSTRSSGSSATHGAHYEFSNPPALQDADGDGVPDFVEIAHGMDPAGGSDADEDGFSDLDELSAGTNPNDDSNFPAALPPGAGEMIVDARVALQAVDGTATGVADAGMVFHGSSPQGGILGTGVIGTGGPAPAFGRARLRGIGPRMAFVALRSAQTFNAAPAGGNEPRGREMLAVIPALEPEMWSWSTADGAQGIGDAWGFGGVNWQPGSNNWHHGAANTQGTDEDWSQRQLDPLWDSADSGEYSAAGWVAELQDAMNRGAQPYAEVTLTAATSLAAVMFGHLLGQVLEPRVFFGSVEGEELDFSDFSEEQLWRLRRPDLEFGNLPAARAIALLRHVDTQVHASDPASQLLRRLARDIYAQHQALAPGNLGDMPTPLEAFAEMMEWYAVPSQYYSGSSLTNGEMNIALQRLADIVSNPPLRTAVTQYLYTRSETNPPGLSLLETGGGTPRLLLDGSLNPLALPGLSEVPAGTVIRVLGYQDMPLIGGVTAIEVLELSLDSLPLHVGEDSDGDLLADTWEMRHFGTLAFDGYANADGSGYQLMQEYLDGTNPNDHLHSPPVDPVAMSFYDLQIMHDTDAYLNVRWPSRYASAIRAAFQQSTDLADWTTLPALPAFGEAGFFFRTVPIDSTKKFFRPIAELKR